jgi:tetratricopeptide (TPR) repeat protein
MSHPLDFARRPRRALVPAALAILALAAPAAAQNNLTLPDASPKASVSQTVGLSDITISYHRPAVNKRTVWGELVPYGDVWRAGANENTTITFSTPVTVGGKPLAAGTYGLHMIPTKGDWTIAFSKQAHAWGSFSYDEKEDALRITVTPKPADYEERLSYRFVDPTMDGVTVALHWEKLEVPFTIGVDTKAVTLASIQDQLRGLPRFGWQGWNQAANWASNNGYIDQGLEWSDRSLGLAETFQNLRVKAALLEKKGDTKTAAALREKSLKVANENDINLYAYQLMGQKKTDEAIAMFQKNVKDHPTSWNTYDSLAEGYATKGDKKLAVENYTKALNMAPDNQKKRINEALAKLKM